MELAKAIIFISPILVESLITIELIVMIKIDLQKWIEGKSLWFAFIAFGLGLELVAVFYQYVMQEPPCVLCIHFRLLAAILVIFSAIGLFLRNGRVGRLFASFLLLLTFSGMAERSYQLLGTERGFILGSCSMDLGLPQWLTVQQWVPWLFEVKTTCGYTPIIAFGISMAESLMGMSTILVFFAMFMVLISIKKH